MTDAGFFLAAYGRRYLDEALGAVASVRRVMPEWPVTVACDLDDPRLAEWGVNRVALAPPQPGENVFLRKVEALALSPYGRTVFLDSDTLLLQPVPELFALLERVPLAAALEWALVSHPVTVDGVELPDAFPEYNTGVIAWRRDPATEALMACWDTCFRRHAAAGVRHDQPAFREALWRCGLVPLTLPANYNFRINPPTSAQVVKGRVRILHGRCGDLDGLAARLLASEDRRLVCGRPALDSLWADETGVRAAVLERPAPAERGGLRRFLSFKG